MRTVSTLCATSSITALASLGLALAHREQQAQDEEDHPDEEPNPTSPQPRDMTAVVTYTNTELRSSPAAALDTPFSLRPSRARRYASEGDSHAASKSAAAQKRYSSLTPDASFTAGMDQSLRPDDESSGKKVSNTSAPPTTWLRRLSSGVSTSRDSSRTPTVSRPVSAAYTAGSQTLSRAGSSAPIFLDSTPPPLQPNKLVKRTTSLRSVNGTSSPGSASKLPLPTFRRPATSHQRSATLQEYRSQLDRSGRMSPEDSTQNARDDQWRPYFTSRVASDDIFATKRRHSTGIPNPIRRVYPDRKYTPTLVSAKVITNVVAAEFDDGLSDDEQEDDMAAPNHHVAPSTASSPFPPHNAHFEEAASPRRSFSIGDLLAAGPQPLWRRSSSKGRPWSSRSIRRSHPRVVSEPRALMGNNLSKSVGLDSERPSKRRELTDSNSSHRSIYSSSSGNNIEASLSDSRPEVDLGLGGDESLYVQYTTDESSVAETISRTQTPSPFERVRRPSEHVRSTTFQPTRVSASHSEITSSIDSDSEYRSVGDNSTDYQSDAAYDSIQTQTTRSSFGRRGPHIEKIFDESPPTFSSGRSTKLRDFLSDAQFSAGDHNGRYRHSTIEEEESVISTPVRSLRNKSVTSTPSAHPHASHIFTSSPPTMKVMPDPDEIDWDAPDEQDIEHGLGIQSPTSFPINGSPPMRSLAFRFGPTLLPNIARSAGSTPQRGGASPTDNTNLFDWSEHQPSPSHPNHSPPRPRTVHGKKDQEVRGSRPSGRRPTSGMHARSHSVPVVPDLDGKRNSVVANKFGTWGVGSKGVTEDWNDDFEFEEAPVLVQMGSEMEEKRIDSGHEMFVPRAIREQQENVVANIGLLRDWGLLIEELKELRMRAVALDMLNGTSSQAWREVDAMIELADQESEEDTLEPRRSPPSSPGFDFSAFEDNIMAESRNTSNHRQASPTVGAIADNVDDRPETPQAAATALPPPVMTRPRKDSELMAQTVIAALQAKRNGTDAVYTHAGGNRKVPFDTATLRHIVPYVCGLKWRVKAALREKEGLYSSPNRRTSLSPQSSSQPQNGGNDARHMYNEFTTTTQTRRERAETDHDGSESPSVKRRGSLTAKMQKLQLPP